MANPKVRKRIYQFDNNIKLIAILRNPIDRLKSAYFHSMNYGFTPVLPLNIGIKKIISGKLLTKYPRSSELLEFGFYAKYLKEYINNFDDQVLVLFFDELKKDKLSMIKKCYSFLGIDNNYVPDEKFLNSRPQKVNYSLMRTALIRLKNRHRFKYNDTNTRLFAKQKTKLDRLICRAIDKVDNRILSKFFYKNNKPSFNKEVKEKLIEIYKPDILELEKILGIDLSEWRI